MDIKRSDEATIIYLLLIIINPETRMGVSKLKDEIEKETISKFDNNVNSIIDGMSSNYTISIDNV